MITKIDSQTAKELNVELQGLLQAFSAKHGLSCSKQRLSYDPDGGDIRLSATLQLTVREDGTSQDEANFKKYASLYGLGPRAFKRIFHLLGVSDRRCRLYRMRRELRRRDTA